MRVVSQNGEVDIPYEYANMLLEGNAAGKIYATEYGRYTVSIAEYSTREKALKAMAMLREEYQKFMRSPSDMPAFAFTAPKVFQFPQDSEIE